MNTIITQVWDQNEEVLNMLLSNLPLICVVQQACIHTIHINAQPTEDFNFILSPNTQVSS